MQDCLTQPVSELALEQRFLSMTNLPEGSELPETSKTVNGEMAKLKFDQLTINEKLHMRELDLVGCESQKYSWIRIDR